MYGYKSHAILDNKCVYISSIMADSWPLSVNIESMGNISLEKVDSIVFDGNTA